MPHILSFTFLMQCIFIYTALLPVIKYEFNKWNFIVQSLFNVWFCVLLYYFHFVFYCTYVRISYVLKSFLLTYCLMHILIHIFWLLLNAYHSYSFVIISSSCKMCYTHTNVNSFRVSDHSVYWYHHNHFTALFPRPPGWAGARRELLDFIVQGKINRGRHRPAGWAPLHPD